MPPESQNATSPSAAKAADAPHLKRVLGTWDLALLCVVAVANLNLVPVVAAGGAPMVWFWLLALVFFFWPQGIAVIEFSRRYPGEGGIYLWSKERFGPLHGFLAGWCYWTNNIFYIPTLLLYLVGIAVYIGGPRYVALGDDKQFVFLTAIALLIVLVALNVRGLGLGKWVNNAGAIGTAVAAAVLGGLAILVFSRNGSTLSSADFRFAGADWSVLNTFGVICFGLVGLELGSVMGDEIRDPAHTVPRGVFWGGIASGVLYVGATLALLLALPAAKIGAVQGILQAVTSMAEGVDAGWLVPPVAFILTVSIAGIASAWLSGSARIPFVAGLDSYLPEQLGRLHPRYGTPYIALITQSVLSGIFVAMSFLGATVEQGYKTLLDLAVVLQLVPFLYLYAAMIDLAHRPMDGRSRYSKGTLWFAGLSGFITTGIGMVVAFIPQHEGEPLWLFETKMSLGTLFFLALAAFFYFPSSRRKAALLAEAAASGAGSVAEFPGPGGQL
ncbi:MAG TPA: APC family permease [Candidatus Acidoferrales bacterium]|nr:APC family permease [Candidatus Acidoferrales bacterium]